MLHENIHINCHSVVTTSAFFRRFSVVYPPFRSEISRLGAIEAMVKTSMVAIWKRYHKLPCFLGDLQNENIIHKSIKMLSVLTLCLASKRTQVPYLVYVNVFFCALGKGNSRQISKWVCVLTYNADSFKTDSSHQVNISISIEITLGNANKL